VVGNSDPKRKWQHPHDKNFIDFAELVSLLKAKADELVSLSKGSIYGLSVIGIDFSDPRERLT
jgi:hypothetical protein